MYLPNIQLNWEILNHMERFSHFYYHTITCKGKMKYLLKETITTLFSNSITFPNVCKIEYTYGKQSWNWCAWLLPPTAPMASYTWLPKCNILIFKWANHIYMQGRQLLCKWSYHMNPYPICCLFPNSCPLFPAIPEEPTVLTHLSNPLGGLDIFLKDLVFKSWLLGRTAFGVCFFVLLLPFFFFKKILSNELTIDNIKSSA